jgi:hypothetical protein
MIAALTFPLFRKMFCRCCKRSNGHVNCCDVAQHVKAHQISANNLPWLAKPNVLGESIGAVAVVLHLHLLPPSFCLGGSELEIAPSTAKRFLANSVTDGRDAEDYERREIQAGLRFVGIVNRHAPSRPVLTLNHVQMHRWLSHLILFSVF